MAVRTKAKYLLFFITINCLTYFGIQSFITSNEYNFLTSFDKNIPMVPEFIWIYHTLLPVIFMTMLVLMIKREIFISTFIALLIATTILSLFYVLFPAFYPRPPIGNDTVSEWLLNLTRIADGAQNTFPSSHVTFSWLLTFFIGLTNYAKKHTWIKWAYMLWAILISIATLLLKQHFIIDVASGMLLATICYFLVKHFAFERIPITI